MIGIGIGITRAAAPSIAALAILASNAVDHGTGTSFSPTTAAPDGTDAVAVLWVSRANGGGNTYTPTITVGGVATTRLGGNSNLATTDVHGFTDLFYVRGAFSGTVTLALTPGASVRPGRMQAFFLMGSRAETALGGSLLVKAVTSGTALSGTVTPTSIDSLVLIQRAIFAAGTPTFASYSPADHTDWGATTLSTSAGLSMVGANSFQPANTSGVLIDSPSSAAASQRNLGAWELVR